MTVGEVYDQLIETYMDYFLPLLNEDEKKIFSTISWAIYPSGSFCGLTSFLVTGERIILLNEGLVHTIATISHWFCYMIEMNH